jgi:ATP-dependent Clp protease, protease subunit
MKMTKDLPIVTKDTKFENATNFLSMGVDFEARRIELNMDVSEVMAAIVIRSLLKMADISKDPIEIYLSTYGGDAYSGFAIYDAIRACPCDVIIYASGKIMSAGTVIFLAGDTRVASPNTRFMIHGASTSTEGKVKDMTADLNEAKIVNHKMIEIFTQRSKMKNLKFWQKKVDTHDVYFGVPEAKEYGFIRETIDVVDKKSTATNSKKKVKNGK